MTAIPNTIRRGAIYGTGARTVCRPVTVSPHGFPEDSLPPGRSPARRPPHGGVRGPVRRLFGKSGRRLALDSAAIKRIFEKEFELALDAFRKLLQRTRLARAHAIIARVTTRRHRICS